MPKMFWDAEEVSEVDKGLFASTRTMGGQLMRPKTVLSRTYFIFSVTFCGIFHAKVAARANFVLKNRFYGHLKICAEQRLFHSHISALFSSANIGAYRGKEATDTQREFSASPCNTRSLCLSLRTLQRSQRASHASRR